MYRNNPKYWTPLSTDHTCPKVWNSPFYYLLMCLKYCCIYGKQCRPWSEAGFCGIWSGFTLFAEACLSEQIRYLLDFCHFKRANDKADGICCDWQFKDNEWVCVKLVQYFVRYCTYILLYTHCMYIASSWYLDVKCKCTYVLLSFEKLMEWSYLGYLAYIIYLPW